VVVVDFAPPVVVDFAQPGRGREGEGGEREKRGGREGWMEGRESQFKTYK
jgi:hypothetical protein